MQWIAIDLDYGSGHEHMLVILLLNLICKYLHPLIAMGNVFDVYMFRIDFWK